MTILHAIAVIQLAPRGNSSGPTSSFSETTLARVVSTTKWTLA